MGVGLIIIKLLNLTTYSLTMIASFSIVYFILAVVFFYKYIKKRSD